MKKSAFTLIELLVVIVIIGILATISVAQFNQYQEKARIAELLASSTQNYRSLLAHCLANELHKDCGNNLTFTLDHLPDSTNSGYKNIHKSVVVIDAVSNNVLTTAQTMFYVWNESQVGLKALRTPLSGVDSYMYYQVGPGGGSGPEFGVGVDNFVVGEKVQFMFVSEYLGNGFDYRGTLYRNNKKVFDQIYTEGTEYYELDGSELATLYQANFDGSIKLVGFSIE